MKKLKKNKLEKISGGYLACGWVGIITVAVYASPGGSFFAGASGLNNQIGRCWNS